MRKGITNEKREWHEETGLVLNLVQLSASPVFTYQDFVIYLYKPGYYFQVKSNSETVYGLWVKLEDVQKHDLVSKFREYASSLLKVMYDT